SATRAAVRAAAKDITGGDKLDPKRTVALVIRGGGGLTQRIEAVLRHTRACGGESRQLEHHPRTGIQFRHAEGQGRPFGGYLELSACSYVGCTGDGELLAAEAENGYRLRRLSDATNPCTNNRATTSGCCGSGTGRRSCASLSNRARTCRTSPTSATPGRSSPTSAPTSARSSATTAPTTAAANIHAPDITLAHGSVPGGLHFAAIDECDSAVDDDKRIRYTADRAILVVEHRGPIAPTAVIIVAPLILHRRGINPLCVYEIFPPKPVFVAP